MSLETPDKIRSLQRKLYGKAKAEPDFRFYLLFDKICREDILRHAYALARENAGAPGVDGVTFAQIEAAGVEAWLAGLREDLASKTYRPVPGAAAFPSVKKTPKETTASITCRRRHGVVRALAKTIRADSLTPDTCLIWSMIRPSSSRWGSTWETWR